MERIDFGPFGDPRRRSPQERRPIDAEALVTWALRRSGRLPWANARDRELAFDKGLSAKPRTRLLGDWGLAAACAGLSVGVRALYSPMMEPGPDAALVLMAIGRLEPAIAALVIACGRAGIRPDWMPGVEPRPVERTRRSRRRHRKVVCVAWEPCSPESLRAARAAYQHWHSGVRLLAMLLAGALESWEICGFAAPSEPWARAV